MSSNHFSLAHIAQDTFLLLGKVLFAQSVAVLKTLSEIRLRHQHLKNYALLIVFECFLRMKREQGYSILQGGTEFV